MRFKTVFTEIEREYALPLTLAATEEELLIIRKISASKTLEEIATIADKISLTSKSPEIRFLKLAITKL